MSIFSDKVKFVFLLFISLNYSRKLIPAELVDALIGSGQNLGFQHYCKIWEAPDGDVEIARDGLKSIASLDSIDAQNACFLLIHGDKTDKQFALDKQRHFLKSENKRTKSLSANFLISFGTPEDRVNGLDVLKVLVKDADINISVLSVYELLIRHEIDQDQAAEIANIDFESSEEIAKLFSIKTLMLLSTTNAAKVLPSLEALLQSAHYETSISALAILSSHPWYKGTEKFSSLMAEAAQSPTSQKGSIAAWYFFQGSTKEKAREIARIRLQNPHIATHLDALITSVRD